MKKFSALFILILILGLITASSCKDDASNLSITKTYTIKTFENVRHAFGTGLSQESIDIFTFNTNPTKVKRIRMFIKLRCPDDGCNAWDMFANIKVQDPETEEWFEIGRYITPYGVDNSGAGKGFLIDVTDFKSLLTGEVKLRSFIEVWGSDGWLVSIDFEITEGVPDYKYYAISPLLDYANWSLGGVPYGEEHDFNLEKNVTINSNVQETSIRTIITGWGHATPVDPDGRPCAEWCFRTHQILIDNEPMFYHDMGPNGCDQNLVQPQYGNWAPDRAGWCPGMEVPVRTNIFENTMAGTIFKYSYELEEWANNFQSNAENKHAYYAITSFVVTKSNVPIERPIVE
jgi:hypothetical protein